MECKICQSEKPSTEFYYIPKSQNKSVCKKCFCDRATNYRKGNLEKIQAYDRARGRTEERLAKNREHSKLVRSESRKYGINWMERNPEKRASHIILGNAIRDGRITRQACEVCGEIKSEAHHDDYAKPLEVRWLCRKHHAELHRKYKD